jgi:N-acetylglucosaminyldiphosphoundecaprenol N-acetyl-beta-D-mannosaminyltransferase
MTEAVVEARPDIVLIALPFPKQCVVAEQLGGVLPGTCCVGVGVSLSFVTGDVKRAPVLLQRLGLEWVHRLVQEPRRLYRRYLIEGVPCALQLLGWSLKQRLSRRA